MPRITVSYRRDDSEAITGRIFDRLIVRYGRDSVFRDIENIPPGVDFRQHIDAALKATDVLLIVIGRRWMGSARQARIQDEADPVRIEVETALNRGIPVVPVLVGDTRMPVVSQLPATLKEFAFRNAVRVDSGQDFDHHIDRLSRALDRTLGAEVKPGEAKPIEPRRIVDEDGEGTQRNAAQRPQAVDADTGQKARREWGGYSRAGIAHVIGSYLVLRCAFKNRENVVAYATDIFWDDAEGGLVFQERNRPDARRAHRGHVRHPNLSMYMYLVSGDNGWLRSVMLTVVDSSNEMHGVLSTLHNVAGAMYVPVATPVVYLKRENFDGDRFGDITPADPHYAAYFAQLRDAIASTYVQMIVPVGQ
ncbi:MAG: toll/interleukin-1 receptor domain-containing protein [Xanthobacteraceae bacterium]